MELSESATGGERALRRQSLVAVFDESGASNTPGEQFADDFALCAIVFSGRRGWKDICRLDKLLQEITGRDDYKYRQVRQSTDARKAVVAALVQQSALCRVFAYYAAGGAFVQQAERELAADIGHGQDSTGSMQNLEAMKKNPRFEGLKDALFTSVPAMSAFAASRRERVSVYLDQRTDLPSISQELIKYMRRVDASRLWGDSYKSMDWMGECPTWLFPAARIADVFAGDVRATFKEHGNAIWKLIQSHGFVGMRSHVAELPDCEWAGLVPVPRVGSISVDIWDANWQEGSTTTTMFRAYSHCVLAGRVSLYSPCGRGCLLRKNSTGFDVFQVMD